MALNLQNLKKNSGVVSASDIVLVDGVAFRLHNIL